MSASNVTATNAAPAPASAPRPRLKPRITQGRYASRAFGLLIDQDCLERWGKHYYARAYGPDALSQLPPDKAERALRIACAAIVPFLPGVIYRAFPNLPRFHHNVHVVECARGARWLIVLRDNSCPEALHAPIDPEDLKGAKEVLGSKTRAKWYHVNEQY